jgi:hypothetical protein
MKANFGIYGAQRQQYCEDLHFNSTGRFRSSPVRSLALSDFFCCVVFREFGSDPFFDGTCLAPRNTVCKPLVIFA